MPNVEQDESIKTLLRLIYTPAESLGYLQTHYPAQVIVSTQHSPAFPSGSLTLYNLQIQRSSVKRPNIVRVRVERSYIHTSKKKRPEEDSDEILEAVMKVGNSTCQHEILRERQALTMLNPKTGNRNK